MLSTVHEFLIVLAAILLRLLVGIWSYSGCHDPPMFGDFEAQRHWMEITSSLKIGDWYRNTSENDLNYWGLDYPPLTAYVSWVFGILARRILPELVYPISSHGYETEDGKFFMRMSVIATDVIVLFPSVIVAVRSFARHDEVMNAWHILISLLIPSLILIDHGHFQYNGVCLGFALLGAVLIVGNHDILGSILFCFSLNFKQMSLYYAPVFFFVLLRKCWLKPNFYLKLRKFIELGLTVLGTFSILWFPFCAFHAANENCFSSLLAVLSRQFPFSRGIFEDKVSNLWYAASVLFEFRGIFTPGQLVAASIFLTIVLLTPICTYLVIHPVSLRGFLLSMIGSALAYFLASYQVHEKSLLLALFPAGLLLLDDVTSVTWFQIFGSFSMYPLLKRDGLGIPYFACNALYIIMSYYLSEIRKTIVPGVTSEGIYNRNVGTKLLRLFKNSALFLSSVGLFVLHVCESTIAPPKRYPDLYPAIFAIYGAANLVLVYLVCVIVLWSIRTSKKVD